MIELTDNQHALVFRFPEVEARLTAAFDEIVAKFKARAGAEAFGRINEAALADLKREHTSTRTVIEFQRTLRIPDDDKEYPLPPGFGAFPIEHVDDHKDRLPGAWHRHGGVLLPLHQREALWLNFRGDYPAALKVGTGKICCVTGEPWNPELSKDPQNYLALPEQPWLDGYVVARGTIRQFVAVPLGKGATVESQLTGQEEWNGMQLQLFPVRPDIHIRKTMAPTVGEELRALAHPHRPRMMACASDLVLNAPSQEYGLGAGGRMKQEIYRDYRKLGFYDPEVSSRCFVHFLNADNWKAATGRSMPPSPVRHEDYVRAGLPWFGHYSPHPAVEAQERLAGLRSAEEILGSTESEGGVKDGEW
mgnify:CR=1 FL=1